LHDYLPRRNQPPAASVQTGMKTSPDESSPNPAVHSAHLQQELSHLITHLRQDVERVTEPRFQALLETSAEILTGLQAAFRHYGEKKETAWGGTASPR
jgi:hypothetical protein